MSRIVFWVPLDCWDAFLEGSTWIRVFKDNRHNFTSCLTPHGRSFPKVLNSTLDCRRPEIVGSNLATVVDADQGLVCERVIVISKAGEWHADSGLLTQEVKDKVIGWYAASFKKTKIQLRYPSSNPSAAPTFPIGQP
jgi:hypothetical protein